MRMLRLFATLAALFASVAAASAREPGELDSARLTKAVAGATLHLDSPIGLTLPIVFSPEGGMTGEAGGLSFFLGASRDRGRWWIADDKLCKKWNVWFEAKTKCVWVRMTGNTIRWRHADGSTGNGVIVARKAVVAEAAPRSAATSQAAAVSKPVARPRPATAAATPPAVAVAVEAVPVPPKPRLVSPRLAALATLDASRLLAAPPLPDTRPAQPAAVLANRQPANIPPAGSQAAALPASPAAPDKPLPTFRVVGVDGFDVLNVRSGPSEAFGVVATIPPDGRSVAPTGPCVGDWCPVRYKDRAGWVNSYFLEPEPRTVTARARPASYSYDVRMNLGALPPVADRH